MILVYCLKAALANPINTAIADFNQLSVYDVPQLNMDQLSLLQSGQLVAVIDGGNGDNQPKRGIAYKLLEPGMTELWLACQDDHFSLKDGTQFFALKKLSEDRFHWYTYVKMPAPIKDRHWVVDSWNNHQMAQQSLDTMWEHPWDLVTDWEEPSSAKTLSAQIRGITPEQFNRAVDIPYSQGAWGLLNLGKKRMMIYHATASAGGLIPESLLVRLMLGTMEEMFEEIDHNARTEVLRHYRSSHGPMYDGGGKLIPKFTAQRKSTK